MPSRISSRNATPPTRPSSEAEVSSTVTSNEAPSTPVAGELTPTLARTTGANTAPAQTEEVLKTYFAPYDDTRQVEVGFLNEVIAARKADPKVYPEGQNPYKITYAVYNISSKEVLHKLVEADRAGIDVQVLIEDHQLDEKKTWNTGDDFLRENGFSFAADHNKLTSEERESTQLIGIKRSTLMHLKSRIIEYPDPTSGKPVQKLLTGSMNPGQSAVKNDEKLSLVTDPRIVQRYIEMVDAIRDNGTIENQFDANEPVNVLFTGDPVDGGPRVTPKIFEMIEEEDEMILLSVFTLRNLTTPGERGNLVKKLKAAKERGVDVVVMTDRKQSDGIDANGGRRFWDDRTEDLLREAGIPVYECINDAGPYNAMHAKSAIFGLSDMKVITDTGNWTKAALGNRRGRSAQNEESYLFIDSKKLDNNETGMRYLGNYMHLLRKYADQTPEHPDAEAMINKLASHPNWPRVSVDFSVMAHTFMGQDVYITGDHPALGNWTEEGPGLKLNTGPGRYPFWESGGTLELPFGTQFEFKVVKRNPNGSIEWQQGKNGFLIVDPSDRRFGEDIDNDPLTQHFKAEF